MTEQELAHIKAIVDGAAGRLDARLDGLQREMGTGFKSTHARITEQAERVHELAGHVAETNGKVRDLRSDVDHTKEDLECLETTVGEVKERETEWSTEMVSLRETFLEATSPRLHKRDTDDPDAPPVFHQRKAIDETAPLTLGMVLRYWPVAFGLISAGAGAVLLIGKIAGKW